MPAIRRRRPTQNNHAQDKSSLHRPTHRPHPCPEGAPHRRDTILFSHLSLVVGPFACAHTVNPRPSHCTESHRHNSGVLTGRQENRTCFYPCKRWTLVGEQVVLRNHARMLPELANITITSREKTLDELPTYSGVYRFFSDESTLLYVGKSVDIRARVNSHFQEGRKAGRHQR